MEINENRFEAIGTVDKIIASMNSNNLLVTLKVRGDDGDLYPTIRVPEKAYICLRDNKYCYIKGYIHGHDMKHESGERGYHIQNLVATQATIAKGITPDKQNSYFRMYLTGKLIRLLDSGHGWWKYVLETTVYNNGSPLISNVSINYNSNNMKLIRIRDLEIGRYYETITNLSTRLKEKDGKEIRHQDIIAVFNREVPERFFLDNETQIPAAGS